MTVHILKPDTTPMSVNRQAAIVGFTLRGDEVRLFGPDDAADLPLDAASDIVVGGVGIVRAALPRMGLPVPSLPTIPEALRPFAGRTIWQAPMREARQAVERGEALFVKPCADQPKLFDGRALITFKDLIATAAVPDDMIVECATLTPFVSEYRVFVIGPEIIGVRPYKGDLLTFPDPATVRAAREAFTDAPAAYALDLGVCEDGVTRLVEVTDAYATAAYGLSPARYAAFIAARWEEWRATPDA
ncbi:MAG: ATP-grasp domain-containing protein [Pseudomonadota bacterium]